MGDVYRARDLRLDPDASRRIPSGSSPPCSALIALAARRFSRWKWSPNDALSHRGLAITLHLTGSIREAIPHYQAALDQRPSDFELWNGLGGALAQTGQLEEAEKMLRESLRLRPDFVQARTNLDRVLRASAASAPQ